MGKKGKRRKARRGYTAKTADPYVLYHESVQSADAEVEFLTDVYRQANGRDPERLREDFCGTAIVAAEWVRQGPDKHAVGVDLDPRPLAWSEENVRAKLGEAAARLQLVQADVRTHGGPRADVILALNFSYSCFQARADLVAYMAACRRRLRPGGIFIIDAFGGTESMEILEESTPKDGFTYVWDQDEFDPVTHRIRCYIHFRFPDGSRLDRAFSYDWRLWTLPELRDCLADAGFASTGIYLEQTDDEGEGTGEFERVEHSEPCEGLVAYLVSRV